VSLTLSLACLLLHNILLHFHHVCLDFLLDCGVSAHEEHERVLEVLILHLRIEEDLVVHLELLNHELKHLSLLVTSLLLELPKHLHHVDGELLGVLEHLHGFLLGESWLLLQVGRSIGATLSMHHSLTRHLVAHQSLVHLLELPHGDAKSFVDFRHDSLGGSVFLKE